MSGTVALWFNNCSLCLINLLKTCRLYSLHITQQRRGGSSPGAIKEAVIDHRSENGTPGKIALIQTPVLPSLIILQGMKRTPPNILFFCLQCISMRPIWFFFAPIVSQKIRATSDWHSMPTQHICSMNIYQHLSSVQNPSIIPLYWLVKNGVPRSWIFVIPNIWRVEGGQKNERIINQQGFWTLLIYPLVI